MKPLTATRSIRFVVALYSVRRIVSLSSSTSPFPSVSAARSEKVRRTRGDNSASTCNARMAEEARRRFKRGTSMTLSTNQQLSTIYRMTQARTHNEQGNSDVAVIVRTQNPGCAEACVWRSSSGTLGQILYGSGVAKPERYRCRAESRLQQSSTGLAGYGVKMGCTVTKRLKSWAWDCAKGGCRAADGNNTFPLPPCSQPAFLSDHQILSTTRNCMTIRTSLLTAAALEFSSSASYSLAPFPTTCCCNRDGDNHSSRGHLFIFAHFSRHHRPSFPTKSHQKPLVFWLSNLHKAAIPFKDCFTGCVLDWSEMAPTMVHPVSYGQVIEYIQGMKHKHRPPCKTTKDWHIFQIDYT